MFKAAGALYAAHQYADGRTGAYIIHGMHKTMGENDLIDSGDGEDYYEIIGDLLGDLKSILRHSPALFAKERTAASLSLMMRDQRQEGA